MGNPTGRFYHPPFLPYSERKEARDPNPALRDRFDGCWAWTAARAIDAITGGNVARLNEAQIRAAAGVPDRPHQSDGGTIDDQLRAIRAFVPKGTPFELRPTRARLVAHLASGGLALLAGPSSKMPREDRAYDPAFFDANQGHNIYVQGTGDGQTLVWGNPERFESMPDDPPHPIDAALRFVFSGAPGEPHVEALLFSPAELTAGVAMAATFLEADMRITLTRETGLWHTNPEGTVDGYDPAGLSVQIHRTDWGVKSPAHYDALVHTDGPVGGFHDFLAVPDGLYAGLWVPISQTADHTADPDRTPFSQADLDAARAAGFAEGKASVQTG